MLGNYNFDLDGDIEQNEWKYVSVVMPVAGHPGGSNLVEFYISDAFARDGIRIE